MGSWQVLADIKVAVQTYTDFFKGTHWVIIEKEAKNIKKWLLFMTMNHHFSAEN